MLIESGVALGRGIPLLVIYEDDSSVTAAWPPSVTIARTSLLNTEALSSYVTLFFAKIQRGPEKIYKASKKPAICRRRASASPIGADSRRAWGRAESSP